MRNSLPILGENLVGPDVHALIHLTRVHRDDLDVELFGERERKVGLP